MFRRQALDHISTRHYGTVILGRQLSHRLLTWLSCIIGCAIIAFFTFFSTTRKAHCEGLLLPTAGVIRVMPAQAGMITEVRVKEGQVVRAGDIMFVLSSERSSSRVDSTQKTISTLLQGRRDSFGAELKLSDLQSRQRTGVAKRKVQELSLDIDRIRDQIALQQQRVALSEQSFERYHDLEATKFISTAQLQDRQGELLDQRQRLADLRRTEAGSRRDLATAEAEVSDLLVQARRDASGLQRNMSSIEQDLTENEARREILVRAPSDGMVTAITTEIGQQGAVGAAVASVLPAGAELEAELYAPSRSAGFIKPGMIVLLRYQAYPYQKFGQYGAVVREVSSTSLSPQDLASSSTGRAIATEPLYRIRLKLEKQEVQAFGKHVALKSGMLLDASIMLENRRLYEWILEPLYSISGRL